LFNRRIFIITIIRRIPIFKTIFKKFADPAGKCRELSMKVTKLFFQNATNFVPILGYFIPAFMQRIPPEIAFDEEMKVLEDRLAALR
jgi:hypothetical protein